MEHGAERKGVVTTENGNAYVCITTPITITNSIIIAIIIIIIISIIIIIIIIITITITITIIIIGFFRFSKKPFGFVRFRSVTFGSVRLRSIVFGCVRLRSVTFGCVRLPREKQATSSVKTLVASAHLIRQNVHCVRTFCHLPQRGRLNKPRRDGRRQLFPNLVILSGGRAHHAKNLFLRSKNYLNLLASPIGVIAKDPSLRSG